MYMRAAIAAMVATMNAPDFCQKLSVAARWLSGRPRHAQQWLADTPSTEHMSRVGTSSR